MKRLKFTWILFLSFISSSQIQASVVLEATRIIYEDINKEVSLSVTNSGQHPVLLQSWIDLGNIKSTPEDIDVPFLITPPITRIDSKESQTLRIRYIGVDHDQNKETVYWLNVLEVPPKSKSTENELNIAYRTRIKLFLRPANLKDFVLSESIKKIKWNIIENKLNIINPTPFYISLTSINVENDQKKFNISGEMIPPLSNKYFKYNKSDIPDSTNLKVTLNYINDFGGINSILILQD